MINTIKSFYISAYTTALFVVSVITGLELLSVGFNSSWTGILIAVLPSFLFFARLFASPIARTSANLNSMLVLAIVGSIVALALAKTPDETFYAYLYACGLGIAGSTLYIYWYSRLGRTPSDSLAVGQTLPVFELKSSNGEQWKSNELANHPALMLFFRGNWCPLCMAQIKEVAAMYRELEGMGVKVYLVSPQPEGHTKSLAKKFDVDYHFMIDEDNQAAKQLGIEALQGTPKGLEALGYYSDTVLPTAILTDNKGKIIFSDQTDNYRVRPEPDTFIRVFNEHGLSAT